MSALLQDDALPYSQVQGGLVWVHVQRLQPSQCPKQDAQLRRQVLAAFQVSHVMAWRPFLLFVICSMLQNSLHVSGCTPRGCLLGCAGGAGT